MVGSAAGRQRRPYIPILVAALGYFVDIYDLILFSIVRVPSLTALGLSGDALLESGVLLLNMQMAGMLVGGIAWGVMGDRRGRLSVLFGSIVLYSIANIANAFVHDVSTYAALRFIAGVGLAGELGAGITLVSEILPKEVRGYGTTIVASVGVMGAVVAVLVGDAFDWRIAYIVGGVMGLALLVLRIGVFESGLFEGVQADDGRARQLLRAVCQAGADAALSQRRPGRPADLVRHRHPDHVRAGARRGRRRVAGAQGRARGALRLSRPDGRRPGQRADQPVDAQPQARAGAVPRDDAGLHPGLLRAVCEVARASSTRSASRWACPSATGRCS